MKPIDMSEIFINHYKMYPKMQIQDYLKLLYQSCFGPFHLHGNPSHEKVQAYIDTELENMTTTTGRYIEEIGNGYARVYLDAVESGNILKEELLSQFVSSMNEPVDIKEATNLFHTGLTLFTTLCDIGILPYKTEYEHVLTKYLKEGIRPVHHSDEYRTHYQPHYRVIKKPEHIL